MMAPVSVRTITASCDVQSPEDPALEQALEFLRQARARFQEAGYRVQTSRIAARLPGARPDDDWHRRVVAIDRLVAAAGVLWATGPEPAAADPGRFPAWCARVVADTAATFLSVDVGGTDRGVDPRACEAAARTIATLARSTEGGEGNFRFAGAAGCPPGLPFFPAARHEGYRGSRSGWSRQGSWTRRIAGTADPRWRGSAAQSTTRWRRSNVSAPHSRRDTSGAGSGSTCPLRRVWTPASAARSSG
jgi:hypothetical protein